MILACQREEVKSVINYYFESKKNGLCQVMSKMRPLGEWVKNFFFFCHRHKLSLFKWMKLDKHYWGSSRPGVETRSGGASIEAIKGRFSFDSISQSIPCFTFSPHQLCIVYFSVIELLPQFTQVMHCIWKGHYWISNLRRCTSKTRRKKKKTSRHISHCASELNHDEPIGTFNAIRTSALLLAFLHTNPKGNNRHKGLGMSVCLSEWRWIGRANLKVVGSAGRKKTMGTVWATALQRTVNLQGLEEICGG